MNPVIYNYCDKCGKVLRKPYSVLVDGKVKVVCSKCYKRMGAARAQAAYGSP